MDGVPVVTATVNWLMGEEHLDPDWSFGPEGERFEVEVTGDPSVKLTFKGLQPETVEAGLVRNPGIVSTANHCVNAIPYVVAAEPGIKTYLDLPLIAGRAAPQPGPPAAADPSGHALGRGVRSHDADVTELWPLPPGALASSRHARVASGAQQHLRP